MGGMECICAGQGTSRHQTSQLGTPSLGVRVLPPELRW